MKHVQKKKSHHEVKQGDRIKNQPISHDRAECPSHRRDDTAQYGVNHRQAGHQRQAQKKDSQAVSARLITEISDRQRKHRVGAWRQGSDKSAAKHQKIKIERILPKSFLQQKLDLFDHFNHPRKPLIEMKPPDTTPSMTVTFGTAFLTTPRKRQGEFQSSAMRKNRRLYYQRLLPVCRFKGLCECVEERSLIDIVDVYVGNDALLVDDEQGSLGHAI